MFAIRRSNSSTFLCEDRHNHDFDEEEGQLSQR